MTIHVQSTTKIVTVNGVPCRIWEGITEEGIPIHAFITRIAVNNEDDNEQFKKELQHVRPPSADVAAYPLRIIL